MNRASFMYSAIRESMKSGALFWLEFPPKAESLRLVVSRMSFDVIMWLCVAGFYK